jgi:glycosyltransferase involved in cell wall biosynthesis
VLVPGLYNRASRVVAVSRDIGPELASLGVSKRKIRTINNFFDVDGIIAKSRVALGPQEQALFESAPVLVAAGRLAPQKNPLAMLDVLATLKRSRPSRLVWVGDGPLRKEMVERARDLGLAPWDAQTGAVMPKDADVCLLGNRTNPFPYIARATLFVLPSVWEGFPLALCEAMICGLPAAATDCSTGPREIMAPSTQLPAAPIQASECGEHGLLMPLLHLPETRTRSVRVWAETLDRLLDDAGERQRLGAAASRRMQDFTAAKIVPEWLELIAELLSPVGSRR